MLRVDVAIVGGGVTGLASALALAKRGASVCLLERESRPGRATSTHNSGVIHAEANAFAFGGDPSASAAAVGVDQVALAIAAGTVAGLGTAFLRERSVGRTQPNLKAPS